MKHISSLNGLRAISILVVIAYHATYFTSFRNNSILVDGPFGVNVFFVISGFLITSLLLNEEVKYGRVSLKDFYIRRSFRILPVYYSLVAVYAVLQLFKIFHLSTLSWITTLSFTKNFYPSDWESVHLWSLSTEEQFYLLWPLLFSLFKNSRKTIAWFIIGVVPLFRCVEYRYSFLQLSSFSIFNRADALMWGCLLALYKDYMLFIAKKIKYKSAFIFLLFCAIQGLKTMPSFLSSHNLHLGFIVVTLGDTNGIIADILVCAIIAVSIVETDSVWFRFLNMRVMDYIGKLSYSLYIWQQLFFSPAPALTNLTKVPFNLVYICIAALISYYFIEQPFLKLRSRFLKKKPDTVMLMKNQLMYRPGFK